MKRYLTQREVDRCEQAKEPACTCRCGGAKHGAKRVPAGGDYSTLPMDDPHYRPSMTKAQTIRFLNRAYTHVIANCWGWTDDLFYKSWRDAQHILLSAKREVVKL